MKKEDCRVGMVVYDRHGGVKGVVVKINPKNARVRTVEDMKHGGGRGSGAGSLWNMPYHILEPVVSENISTEMTMRSFEQPENEGIKKFFEKSKDTSPLDFPENSPEWHIMKAICEIWRRLEEESLENEAKDGNEVMVVNGSQVIVKSGGGRRVTTVVRELRGHYSDLINKMFSAIGRYVPKDEAERWESGTNEEHAVVPS